LEDEGLGQCPLVFQNSGKYLLAGAATHSQGSSETWALFSYEDSVTIEVAFRTRGEWKDHDCLLDLASRTGLRGTEKMYNVRSSSLVVLSVTSEKMYQKLYWS
jgi:hypothetical protein